MTIFSIIIRPIKRIYQKFHKKKNQEITWRASEQFRHQFPLVEIITKHASFEIINALIIFLNIFFIAFVPHSMWLVQCGISFNSLENKNFMIQQHETGIYGGSCWGQDGPTYNNIPTSDLVRENQTIMLRRCNPGDPSQWFTYSWVGMGEKKWLNIKNPKGETKESLCLYARDPLGSYLRWNKCNMVQPRGEFVTVSDLNLKKVLWWRYYQIPTLADGTPITEFGFEDFKEKDKHFLALWNDRVILYASAISPKNNTMDNTVFDLPLVQRKEIVYNDPNAGNELEWNKNAVVFGANITNRIIEEEVPPWEIPGQDYEEQDDIRNSTLIDIEEETFEATEDPYNITYDAVQNFDYEEWNENQQWWTGIKGEQSHSLARHKYGWKIEVRNQEPAIENGIDQFCMMPDIGLLAGQHIFEIIFFAWYSVEILLRIVNRGWVWWFESKVTIIELLCIIFAFLTVSKIPFLGTSTFRTFAILRCCRLFKSCQRVLKRFPSFHKTEVYIRSIIPIYFSTGTLIFTFILYCATLMVLVTKRIISHDDLVTARSILEKGVDTSDLQQWVLAEYVAGSLERAVVSLMQLSTLDNWTTLLDIVMGQVDEMPVAFVLFLFFLFSSIMLLPLIMGTATLLTIWQVNTKNIAKKEMCNLAEEERLCGIFERSLGGPENLCDYEMFQNNLERPFIKKFIESYGFDTTSACSIFQWMMVHRDDGYVTPRDYSIGLRQLKREVTRLEFKDGVNRIVQLQEKMKRGMEIHENIQSNFPPIEKEIDEIQQSMESIIDVLENIEKLKVEMTSTKEI